MATVIKPKHDFMPCVPGALRGGLSRTAFFDGMVLSEADLLREQGYWRTKRKLTNRALGNGVVWGLTLNWDARARQFTLCPGYGLSCCGDDLVVTCPETIHERDLIDPCGADFRGLLVHACGPCDERPDGPIEACLLLEYVECPEDPRRVYEGPCAEEPHGCRYGAVRETARLRLVPPPAPESAGPIERFCDKIREIRERLLASGVAMPDPLAGEASAIVSLTHVDNNDRNLGGVHAPVGMRVNEPAQLASTSTGPARVKIGLAPPPGRFFSSVNLNNADRSPIETLMGVFETTGNAQVTHTVRVESAPLFGAGDALALEYLIVGTQTGNESRITATLTRIERLARRPDCSTLLAGGVFASRDAGCTLKTLALAVLCGWFKGAFGVGPCAGEPRDADPARAALAWAICWLAWRALFGIDIQQAPDVEKCLRQLFADWCDGFHYKGPRCDANEHGIILGCVQISPKGKILCFDEWRHRRHVLTGPLLTHWGAQLGLAPLDVAATRLASWICCVARAELPEVNGAEIVKLLGEQGALAIGNGALAFGKDYEQNELIHGARVAGMTRKVSALEFVGRMIALLSGADYATPLATATDVSVTTVPGLGVHLLEGRTTGRPGAISAVVGRLEAELYPHIREMPATARAAAFDVVNGLAAAVSLADLKAEASAPRFEAAVRALEDFGVATVADLVELGPEPAADRVREMLAAHPELGDARAVEKAVGAVYNRAVQTLAVAGEAVAKEAEGRSADEPFTRADLEDTATINALRSATNDNLRGRGLSVSAMKAIAAKAAAARS